MTTVLNGWTTKGEVIVDGNYIIKFQSTKKELKLNNYFLDIDNYGRFIVGKNKYHNKWRSILNKHDAACTQSTDIGVFDSLDESRAFAIGISVGKGKSWKYLKAGK